MVEKKQRARAPVNYAMLSLFQYVASIFSYFACIGQRPLHEFLDFTQKSMFWANGCTFFLISSALCA